jgi:hypothetical protein
MDLVYVHLTIVNMFPEILSESIVFGGPFGHSLFPFPILKVAEDRPFIKGQHITDFSWSLSIIKKLEGDNFLAIGIHSMSPV